MLGENNQPRKLPRRLYINDFRVDFLSLQKGVAGSYILPPQTEFAHVFQVDFTMQSFPICIYLP